MVDSKKSRLIVSQFKKILLKSAQAIVKHELSWSVISRTVVRGSQFLCAVRHEHEVTQIVFSNAVLRNVLAEKNVISGPFEGMKYGPTKAFCSAYYPKLLGVYESELNNIVTNAVAKNYSTIVDVGAADGYYAVGFAMKNPQAKVIAYEMDARARTELKKLIESNGVAKRVEIRTKCEPDDLLSLRDERGLIIMDCEGYEDCLLNPQVIHHLKSWDFIIETHDGLVPEITERLSNDFALTHKVISIEVIHDRNKADHLNIPLLRDIPRRDVDTLLTENRQHACLRWIACYANESLS